MSRIIKKENKERGVAGQLMLNYLLKGVSLNTQLGMYLSLAEKGLEIRNERLTHFALSKVVVLFDNKQIDSHTLVVIFSGILSKQNYHNIKTQNKVTKLFIAQLTRCCLYIDSYNEALRALNYLRSSIANSESTSSLESIKRLWVFDDRIMSALNRYCNRSGTAKDIIAKNLSSNNQLNPVEKILNRWVKNN